MEAKRPRVNWSGRVAFMMAAAASAVGLGNLWRFPYLAAKYGGGFFLVIYLLLVVTFGFTLMTAEVAIGRRSGLSAIGAFHALRKKYAFIGILATLVPAIILPYYCVIGGWVLRYLHRYAASFAGDSAGQIAADVFFGAFISHPTMPLVYAMVFIAATFAVVAIGVKNGIERSNRIMMPLLLIMAVVIAIFSILQPGASAGLKFYLLPDFSPFYENGAFSFARAAKTTAMTFVGAMGQMFYSLSLAMGIMITYGSYMRKEDSIEKSVRQIELIDTGVSFLCGLMVIPAIVALSGSAAAVNSGPGLMFQTLPKVFMKMGFPATIGTMYFTLVLFAALTSAISLMETLVASIHDTFGLKRITSCLIALVFTAVMAIPSALGYGFWESVRIMGKQFLDFFDFISNSLLMPVVALLTCYFVGWAAGPSYVIDEVEASEPFRSAKLFSIMIRYVAPVLLIIILVSSIMESMGLMVI